MACIFPRCSSAQLLCFYGATTISRRKLALKAPGSGDLRLKSVQTRFRAYQLGSAGSSFSYFADGHFTVLEGRLTDVSKSTLIQEMVVCGVETADTLHITSWDTDHCSPTELLNLLTLTRPRKIECPGYEPHTDSGKESSTLLRGYEATQQRSNRPARLEHITPTYISSLQHAEELAFQDVFYNPRFLHECSANNNSTVKFFRKGSFNVLSLGDVESQNISARLRGDRSLCRETDVMILAHHGAANGFTNKRFLKAIDPQLAICSSDYANRFDHPRDEITDLLHEQGIRLMTTKTGDVIIESQGDHTGWFRVVNLCGGSTENSSTCTFRSRKAKLLSYNRDTIRQLFAPRPPHPR